MKLVSSSKISFEGSTKENIYLMEQCWLTLSRLMKPYKTSFYEDGCLVFSVLFLKMHSMCQAKREQIGPIHQIRYKR